MREATSRRGFLFQPPRHHCGVKPGLKLSILRYLWPAPMGLALFLIGLAIAKFGSHRAFLNVHFWLEIGIVVSMFASVIYSIRLSGKGRSLAPRWVRNLNAVFGLSLLGWSAVPGIIGLFSS